MQLSEILLEQGLLDSAGLERALKAQRELGDDLGDILIKLGIVSEGSLAAALARQHGLPLAAKADYPTAPLYLSKVSLKIGRAHV